MSKKNSLPNDLFIQSLFSLSNWFHSHSRQLPWRDSPTPYHVWISEIMLQQTQVATVLPYFNRFISAFPSVESLAQAELDSVLALWSGLGYYSRARNLHKTANLVVAGQSGAPAGSFPENRRDLEALPGIGPYTAGAILSIAFSQYEAILDGNLERVFSRLLQIPKDELWKRRLWKISWLFINKAKQLAIPASEMNQSLMELGALVCRPTHPDCEHCPLQKKCRSLRLGTVDAFPQKGRGTQYVDILESCFCFSDQKGRMLLVKDSEARWRRGAWDFPTELPPQISNSLAAECQVRELPEVKLTVTHHRIRRKIFLYQLAKSDLEEVCVGSKQFRWFEPDEIDELPMASPLMKSLNRIRSS